MKYRVGYLVCGEKQYLNKTYSQEEAQALLDEVRLAEARISRRQAEEGTRSAAGESEWFMEPVEG